MREIIEQSRDAVYKAVNSVLLQRNVSSQYYYRMLQTQKKDLVRQEMEKLTAPFQEQKLEFIKNPVAAEFLLASKYKLLSYIIHGTTMKKTESRIVTVF